jgi:hypothetical protein
MKYKQGKPFHGGERGQWFRIDTYLPTGDNERWFVAGPDDNSPAYPHWEPGKYNAACPCCWLGFGHSENEHNKTIELTR